MRFSLLIKKVFNFLPLKNIILFESCPDLSDNTKAVFDELIKRGYNKKYKLVWVVEKFNNDYPKIKNVIYIRNSFSSSLMDKIKRFIFFFNAKCLISCNRHLTSFRPEQFSIYLSHGTPMKSIRGNHISDIDIKYFLAASGNVSEIIAYEMLTSADKVVSLGFPRNDALINKGIDIKGILKTNCSKVIVWYPTFRQNKNPNGVVLKTNALPILHNSEEAVRINDFAQKNDILIVLKPHFAQDISYLTDLNLSNIRFIDDSFFSKNDFTSYEFVGNCDALITDYSSIYYDFTLCDKPIAVIWEDIEEYRKKPGFAVDLDYYLKGAVKVYNSDEFIEFLTQVSNDVDILKEERNEIKILVNHSCKPDNTARVTDFIIEKANLKL